MTPDDAMDRSVTPREADQLNAYLDQVARGHRDHGQGLDPTLVATVDAVTSLGKREDAHAVEPDSVDRGWTTLMATRPGAVLPVGREQGVKLGLVASLSGFPLPRPRAWPVGLVSAVAAILLVAIVGSHYADLPGGPSTSTVMAAGAPTVTPSKPVVSADCSGGVATTSATTRTGDPPTAVASTWPAIPTTATCGSSVTLDRP